MIELHNRESIQDIINTHSMVAVRFTAEWCGPCKTFAPAFAEVAADPRNEDVHFLVADADKNQALTAQYGVRGLPSVLFFYDGHLIGRVSGAMTADKFQEVLHKQFTR